MIVYMFYLFVGPYLWVTQVLAVVTFAALSWRSPSPGGTSAFAGVTAATIAVSTAAVFAVLMSPVAIMVALRRNKGEFPTHWTDPPGLACIAQAILLAASAVNMALVQRRG